MPNIAKPSGVNLLWAAGGTKVDPGVQKLNIGWVVELPPYQYQNWLDNRQDTFIAHINQHGIAEWDGETEYQGGLSYTQGSNGVIYKCTQTNTNRNPANPVNSLYWVVAFEVYGSVATVQNALTAHITNYQTLSGISNLAAARTNLSVYSRAESDTRFASLNGSQAQVFNVAVATQPEHAVRLGQVSALLTQATEPDLGLVRLASNTQTEVGTDDLTAITPLKASSVFLKKSGNLSGLANVGIARTNLGLGTAAVQPSTAFLNTSNNLSDLPSVSTARTNLGLTSTATQPESYFLRASQNLSDLQSASAARTNLGLTSTATTALSLISLKSENLAGLANIATARTNLGLGTVATLNTGQVLQSANNLSDLSNTQSARNNLGLGSAATLSTFGVPGNLDFSSLQAKNGYTVLPNGLVMQWGFNVINYNQTTTSVLFPTPFPNNCFNITATVAHPVPVSGTLNVYVNPDSVTNTGFIAIGEYDARAAVNSRMYWFAIGN